MKLYYHHVGVDGADSDFPKTVFTERSVHLVHEMVPDQVSEKVEMMVRLTEEFPGGVFNCWGVPQGAVRVIDGLRAGDAVLLVRAIGDAGTIPAFGIVRAYWPVRLPELSKALWGSERYPFIFFFTTVPLSLTWKGFLRDMGYSERWDPRGRFYSVAAAALERWGGAAGYVDHLLEHHRAGMVPEHSLSIRQEARQIADPREQYEVERAYESVLSNSFQEEPALQDSAPRVTTKRTAVLRSATFKLGVRKLYGYSCAVCGLSVWSPDAKPEVQGAHIFPKRLNGSDDLRNGVSLCRMHHWALDVGWVAFSDDRMVLVRADIPEEEGYNFIVRYRGTPLREPTVRDLAPHPIYLQAHRRHYGFEE